MHKLGFERLPEALPLNTINQVVGPEIKDALVFDIGANRGMMTRAYKEAGARVVAVEPQAFLTENNPDFENCVVLNVCVSDAVGEVPFYQSDLDTISSCSPEWQEGLYKNHCHWEAPRALPCTTLDQLIATFGEPKYIKIDVENFEHRVLAGLSKPPALLSFEFTGGYPECFNGCLDWMHSFQFTELLAFEVVKRGEQKFNQIIRFRDFDGCAAYYDLLPKFRQADMLLVSA